MAATTAEQLTDLRKEIQDTLLAMLTQAKSEKATKDFDAFRDHAFDSIEDMLTQLRKLPDYPP